MKIRLKKFPEKTNDFLGRGRVITVGDTEIKWDTRIRAWECSLPGVGLMRSYLIARVVDGLLAAGEDLGQWGRSGG